MSDYNPNVAPKKRPFSLQLDVAMFEPATEEEKAQHETMRESTTFFRDGMRKLFKNPLAVGSMIVLLIILLTIVIAPMIVPYSTRKIRRRLYRIALIRPSRVSVANPRFSSGVSPPVKNRFRMNVKIRISLRGFNPFTSTRMGSLDSLHASAR